MNPSLSDGQFFKADSSGVCLEESVDTDQGEYAGELHDPPDQYFDAQKGISGPRGYEGDDEDGKCDIGIESVRFWDAGSVLFAHSPLPPGAGDEDGWEEEVYDIVRDQCYAEADDDEVYSHQWEIDAEAACDLFAF